MNEIIHKIFKYSSVCSYCGSVWVHDSGLCQECYKVITNQYLSEMPTEAGTSFYHYSWNPNVSDLLSNHLHSLKGWQAAFKWKYYAYVMTLKYRAYLPKGRTIKVVFPPSRLGLKDHAYYFAFYTAYYLGGELVSLKREPTKGSKSQKAKSAIERQEISFYRDEIFSDRPASIDEDIWLFVDDVLTTGATYLAVKKH